jgi:DNA-binding transcriptional MerR regulator
MEGSQVQSSGERGGKAAGAFRTISEVAGDLDVPQHVLRFWESKFSQVKPLKRGGGRRYYRPEDVDLLRGIRHLLYTDGYTIKGVQKLLRDHGTRSVRDSGRALAEEGADQVVQPRATPRLAADVSPTSAPPVSAPATVSNGSAALPLAQGRRLADVVEELSALRDMLRAAKP